MSFFDRFKKKPKADELKPISVKPLSQKMRLDRLKVNKKEYKLDVVILFENKPIGQIPVKLDGFSRDQVAKRVQDGLSMKVLSAHELKTK